MTRYLSLAEFWYFAERVLCVVDMSSTLSKSAGGPHERAANEWERVRGASDTS